MSVGGCNTKTFSKNLNGSTVKGEGGGSRRSVQHTLWPLHFAKESCRYKVVPPCAAATTAARGGETAAHAYALPVS